MKGSAADVHGLICLEHWLRLDTPTMLEIRGWERYSFINWREQEQVGYHNTY